MLLLFRMQKCQQKLSRINLCSHLDTSRQISRVNSHGERMKNLGRIVRTSTCQGLMRENHCANSIDHLENRSKKKEKIFFDTN